MEIKINCVKCGKEFTVNVKTPRTCSKECRIQIVKDIQIERWKKYNEEKAAREAAQGQPGVENQQPSTPEQAGVVPEGDVNYQNNGTENQSETSGGSESNNPDNLGQGTPETDRVDTPQEPAVDTGTQQG